MLFERFNENRDLTYRIALQAFAIILGCPVARNRPVP
jgi:hypothetical protein